MYRCLSGDRNNPGTGLRSSTEHRAVQRTLGISYGDFRHRFGEGVLDRRESQHQMADSIAYRLSNWVSHRSHDCQALRVREDMFTHFAAFDAVALEQHFAG